jgi:hypothetical protein
VGDSDNCCNAPATLDPVARLQITSEHFQRAARPKPHCFPLAPHIDPKGQLRARCGDRRGRGHVAILRETGKPIAEVARELGANEGTLGNWCAIAFGTQVTAFDPFLPVNNFRAADVAPGGFVPEQKDQAIGPPMRARVRRSVLGWR